MWINVKWYTYGEEEEYNIQISPIKWWILSSFYHTGIWCGIWYFLWAWALFNNPMSKGGRRQAATIPIGSTAQDSGCPPDSSANITPAGYYMWRERKARQSPCLQTHLGSSGKCWGSVWLSCSSWAGGGGSRHLKEKTSLLQQVPTSAWSEQVRRPHAILLALYLRRLSVTAALVPSCSLTAICWLRLWRLVWRYIAHGVVWGFEVCILLSGSNKSETWGKEDLCNSVWYR